MAGQIIPDSQTTQEEFIQTAISLCCNINTFFQLAEREVREKNCTDFDNLEFLLKAARAEINSFEEQIFEVEQLAKQEVIDERITATSSTIAGKPEPAMNTAKPNAHSLAVDLTGELAFLNSYLELIRERANSQSDDGLVSLLAAARPRMKRAIEISDELEVSHG